jgi:xanthine dehydrogenase small subunit
VDAASADGVVVRTLSLKDLYQGYKQLAKTDNEYITAIRFRKPTGDFRFNFEKISKRTYLDIATVNTSISLTIRSSPTEDWLPPALSGSTKTTGVAVVHTIQEAHVAAGGVAPVPLYLRKTSE